MKRTRPLWVASLIFFAATPLRAQDSTRIRLDMKYTPGSQPGLVVVAAPGLDSVRKIIERDLVYSDLFTMAIMPDSGGVIRGPLDPGMFKVSGITWAVFVEHAPVGVVVRLFDVATGQAKGEATKNVDKGGVGDARLGIHQLSDQVVTWTGGVGIAATRIVYAQRGGTDAAVWRIDSDGANAVRITRSGIFWTPAWSPDGKSLAYTEVTDNVGRIFLQTLSSGTRRQVPTSPGGNNAWGAEFSPDGQILAYEQSIGAGTDIYATDISKMCCAHPLTTKGNLADNLSPTYSPDGRRIAFLTRRAGSTQIYVMDADGSGQTPLIPEGGAFRPRWSPDNARIVFGRDLSGGGRQIYTYEIGSGITKQWTGTGGGSYNEDPSWAPDSRHIVYKSRQTGREALFIMDLRSGTKRQLTTSGAATYPAWSRTLGNP